MREFTEQELVRRKKLENIKNPYPERYETNYSIKDASMLEDGTTNVSVAGRIVLMRKMGKMSFLTIGDIEGKIQISVKIDMIGEEAYQDFKENFDLGDFIGVVGEVFTTHTGEKTIRADKIEFLGKALKPLPEKFHGLEDIETIYRNRYIDLITNDESKKKFLLRSKFIRELRNFLDEKGYIEIETPILNNKASGATAKPFITHHNALDIDLYLRIAPETYLKRAVVGGFTKVFEIARCFRNEGMDATHLQDFTMIEGYGAYLNYKDNMIFLQNLLQTTIEKTFGTLNITIGDKDIDLSGNWPVVSFRELLLKYSDIDINIYKTNDNNNLKELNIEGVEIEPKFSPNVTSYEAEVDYDKEKVVISAVCDGDNCSVSNAGEKELQVGENRFEIVVTAENGSRKKYNIFINRKEASSDTTLSSFPTLL